MSKLKKSHVDVPVAKNAFVDEGDGVVSFPQGLVITDDTEQRNGTKYDMESMDISEYQGQLTADHVDMLDRIIGGVEGVEKVGSKVIVKKISYLVKENPLARLAYNLLLNAKVPTNFSIETMGPWPAEDDDTYYRAKLIGLSQVVLGNNKNAKLNHAIVQNSIEQSKEDGLDTTEIEKQFSQEIEVKVDRNHSEEENPAEPKEETPEAKEEKETNNNKEEQTMKFVTVRNSRGFSVKLAYKNAAGEEVETEVADGASVDVSEEQRDAVQAQIDTAEAPVEEAPAEGDDKEENAILEAIKAVNAKVDKIEQSAFDKKAAEPKFTPKTEGAEDKVEEMSWQDRTAKQVNAAWDLLKRHDAGAAEVLNKVNEVNLKGLKEDKKVRNSMTIADFGNFVISRELLTEIEGCRNDYTPLVNATNWKETLSTQFAWLNRSGDISMQNVEFCDDGANGNLKPISEYSATIRTADLEELAAVTPVCNAATRFLAADLLGDVAAGYRNDYDRKRAQLVIARLEQAVESNGNSVIFDTSPTVEALVSLLEAYKEIANCTPNGTFILNTSSHATLMAYALRAGVSGPLSQIFTTGTNGQNLFGRPYIVVSDDLLPSLDTAGTVTIEVDGANVTVNHAVFYADLSKFTGRTSGGLQYDLSTEAAYEDGNVVKSAYQRNELVLRGSFFRGGAITDNEKVAGILAPGVS